MKIKRKKWKYPSSAVADITNITAAGGPRSDNNHNPLQKQTTALV